MMHKILVIDDDEGICSYIRDILAESDEYIFFEAHTGKEGLKTIKTEDKKTISVRRGYLIVQRVISETSFKGEAEFNIQDGDRVYTGIVLGKAQDGQDIISKNLVVLQVLVFHLRYFISNHTMVMIM